MRLLPAMFATVLLGFPGLALAADLISVNRAGGFYYTDVSVLVSTDGSYVKTDTAGSCSGTLDATQLTEARAQVFATRRFTTANRKFPENCCDLHTYSLTTRFGSTSFTPDGISVLPVVIEAAADYIDDLITNTCSTTSSSS